MHIIIKTSLFLMVITSSIFAQQNNLDFDKWKSEYGKKFSIGGWSKENPTPWLNYLSAESEKCASSWYIMLGPLGIRTLMHDQNWESRPGFRNILPKALTDSGGLMFNNLEILAVQKGSPSEGQLKAGDYILQIEGKSLKTANALKMAVPQEALSVRGLEYHAGQLIDQAEGRGKIKILVLRIPKNIREKTISTAKRKWQVLKSLKCSSSPQKFSMEIEGGKTLRFNFPKSKLRYLERSGAKFDATITNGEKIFEVKICHGQINLPAGKWTIKGTVSSPKRYTMNIEVIETPKFPDLLKKYLKTVEFEIPKTGSFGKIFDPNNPKVENYSRIMAHALAGHQQPDGSWPKTKSYASLSFHTSIAGLALMSTGDNSYDKHIRRAINYVVKADVRLDKWSYSRGTQLTFLSEYYLKTKDSSVIPAINELVKECLTHVNSDYTIGHSRGIGYEGGGLIKSGGPIACGLAIAEKCNLLDSNAQTVLTKLLYRIQQLSPTGNVPYGRTAPTHKKQWEPSGHGGGFGNGPYFSAALLRGYPKGFIDAVSKKYSTGPYGTTENSHGTQTIQFFWGSLAAHNAGKQAHIDNMSSYLWKFVTHRGFRGLAMKNNAAVEYHGGDGVISEPFWRTSSFIILMNAHKKNLCITGNPVYIKKSYESTPVVNHGAKAIKNYMVRNFKLVNALLGEKSPASLRSLKVKLEAIPDNSELEFKCMQLLNKELPTVAKQLSELQWDNPEAPKDTLLRMIHGVVFQMHCEVLKTSKKELKKMSKEEQKKVSREEKKKSTSDNDVNCQLTFYAESILNRFGRLSAISTADYSNLEVQGTAKVLKSAKNKLLKDWQNKFSTKRSISTSRYSDNKAREKATKKINMTANPQKPSTLISQFKYKLSGIPMSHKREFGIPSPYVRGYRQSLSDVWIKATVMKDYHGSGTIRLLFDNGDAIACEFKDYISITRKAGYPELLLAGTVCHFRLAPHSWSMLVQEIRITKHDRAMYDKITFDTNALAGKAYSIADQNESTGLEIKDSKKEFVINYNFKSDISTESLFMSTTADTKKKHPVKLEAKINGEWVTVLQKSGVSGIFFFEKVRAREFRVKIHPQKARNLKLTELYLVRSLNIAEKEKLKLKSSW